MNSEHLLNLMAQTMEPEQLKASNALGTQCVCITNLFLSTANVDSVDATWIAAMALESLYEHLKTHPEQVNNFINKYKQING